MYSVYHNICEFNKTKENLVFKRVGKDYQHNIILPGQLKLLKKYFNALKRYRVIKYFQNTFLDYTFIKKLDILPCKDYFIGGTCYIDGIFYTEDMTNPIMIGLDKHRRPYLVIKGTCNENPFTLTIFQRYTDSKSTWVYSKHGDTKLLLDARICLSDNNKKLLIKNILYLMDNRNPSYKFDFEDTYHLIENCQLNY